MNQLKKTENLILILLWVLSVSTFTYAIPNNFSLFVSDYVGLAGLLIVTTIFLFKPERKTDVLLILLVFGTLNLASFIYFFNFVITFGFGTVVSPGIQILSLVCLTILIFKRKNRVFEISQYLFGKTEEERKDLFERQKERFKTKFDNLSEQDIDNRLQTDLQPAAKQALIEIKNERKTSVIE
jgi:hypothetical protein